MPIYILMVEDPKASKTPILADDDEEAREAAFTALLTRFDVGSVCGCEAYLRREDGSDVWPPGTVADLIS